MSAPHRRAIPVIKQQLIEIAQQWRTMAAYEEKYAR